MNIVPSVNNCPRLFKLRINIFPNKYTFTTVITSALTVSPFIQPQCKLFRSIVKKTHKTTKTDFRG